MCSRSSCSTCTKADGCGWCARGTCMSVADAASKCSDLFISESDQCPSVGADVSIYCCCMWSCSYLSVTEKVSHMSSQRLLPRNRPFQTETKIRSAWYEAHARMSVIAGTKIATAGNEVAWSSRFISRVGLVRGNTYRKYDCRASTATSVV